MIESFIHKLQYSLLALKRMPVPFVTALYGRALGGGLELGLSAHRVVAARESYVGLVETAVGLVPAGGGCKELLLRMLSELPDEGMDSRIRGNDEHTTGGNGGHTSRGNDGQAILGNDTPNRHSRESGSPSVNAAQGVQRAFETIRMAKVSQHAPDAAAIGYLRASDMIAANPDHLLYRAKAEALALHGEGSSTHAEPVQLPVLGESGRAALLAPVEDLARAGKATDHDLTIARKLAYILSGGDAPAERGQMKSTSSTWSARRSSASAVNPRPKTASPTSSRPVSLYRTNEAILEVLTTDKERN